MENFLGQLVIDEIDYDLAKEHIETSIRSYIDSWAYSYFPKEFRQSDEWRDKDLASKLAFVLNDSKDIDGFIDCLIGKE